MSIHINTPVWLDEETPPPHPSRHLLYQLPPALRVVGSGPHRLRRIHTTSNLHLRTIKNSRVNSSAHIPGENHTGKLRYHYILFVVYKIKAIFIKFSQSAMVIFRCFHSILWSAEAIIQIKSLYVTTHFKDDVGMEHFAISLQANWSCDTVWYVLRCVNIVFPWHILRYTSISIWLKNNLKRVSNLLAL